jgi:hypothetical protein
MRNDPISAAEVLDCPSAQWSERPWTRRREQGPDEQPFSDVAGSMILANIARRGGDQPLTQSFLSLPGDLDAWRGQFEWGVVWCASRGGEFWAWAQGAEGSAKAEVAGQKNLWDDDLAWAFAAALD